MRDDLGRDGVTGFAGPHRWGRWRLGERRGDAGVPPEMAMGPLTGLVRRWARRLNHRLSHWPLSPPPWWCQRRLWVVMGLAVWAAECLTPAAVYMMPLGLIPVLLAAWCGDFIRSLGLALGLPWGSLLSWWWQGKPWPLWVEVVNDLGEMVAMVVTAVLMTALQRHAVRLALERDPRLPRD